MSNDEDDQRAAAAFLKIALSGQGEPPRIVTTHISKIFLSGDRALKLKRAVRFPFLDFRTLDARRDACEAEVAINRRFAPDIYKGVVPLTRSSDGELVLGGGGAPVEWLVDMVRFDEETLFDRLAAVKRGLRRPMIEALADEIARLHGETPVVEARGGYSGLRMIAENNAQSFARLNNAMFDEDAVDKVTAETSRRIEDNRDLLEVRRLGGRVRACHGDLHLRNICLIDDKPTLFDAIEFSPDFSEIDVMYDLAFLLMDLDFCGHRRLASVLLNRYLDVVDESAEVFRLLPVFLSMRAQIRAHVIVAAVDGQDDPEARAHERGNACRYLALAQTCFNGTPPRLIAVGGLSGSGKSRLARELASFLGRAPGARVVRTDVVRKRLAGMHPNSTLGADGYSAEMTQQTYAATFEQAAEVLNTGQCVIIDAVFARREQRDAAEAVAARAGVAFSGIWVDAPQEVRVERIQARRNNVSDATPEIARNQSDYDLGEITWASVDSRGPKHETIAHGRSVLGLST